VFIYQQFNANFLSLEGIAMSNKFGINALIIVTLAVLFYFFFMTAKHDPALSAVNAFAEDPYDAIGSFGIQAAALLGILSLIRAFRLYRESVPSEEQKVFLARTQMLAVLAVAVTLAGDIVAMARYPSLWIGSPDGYELAALLGGLALFAIVAGALVYRSVRETSLQTIPNVGKRAAVVSLASVVILAFYPDNLRQSTLGELFTVVVGAILLFAPMWAFGMSLVPYQTEVKQHEAITLSDWLNRYKHQIGFVILLGILMGLFLALGESTEGGGPHLPRFAFVASVYIGLETAAVLIGYSFLSKPLGLSGAICGRDKSQRN
jgi:hypothetical protein